MKNTPPQVDWLLNYKIRLSARHRRFVSVVMVSSKTTTKELDQVLSEAIRSSDISFPENGGILVVMGETGTPDAMHAVDRYSRTINGSLDANYSVASYPNDAKTAKELKKVAKERLKKADALGNGAAVAED